MTEARPFTTLVENGKLGVLRRMHGMIEHDSIKSREQFRDLMEAVFRTCEINPRVLADDMGFNASTVYRWVDGRSAPHPSLWPRIVDWVKQVIEARLAASEVEESAYA